MGNGLSTSLVRSLIIAASVAASVALLGLILVLLSRGCYARKGQKSDSGTQPLVQHVVYHLLSVCLKQMQKRRHPGARHSQF